MYCYYHQLQFCKMSANDIVKMTTSVKINYEFIKRNANDDRTYSVYTIKGKATVSQNLMSHTPIFKPIVASNRSHIKVWIPIEAQSLNLSNIWVWAQTYCNFYFNINYDMEV